MTDTHTPLPAPTGPAVVPEPPLNRLEALRLDTIGPNHYPTHHARMDASFAELQALYLAQGDNVAADAKARELLARLSSAAPNLLRYLIASDGR